MFTALRSEARVQARPEEIRVRLNAGECVLVVKRGARKSVALHVTRQGEFEVRAPTRMPLAYIEAFVREHRDWLLEKEQKLQAQPAKLLAYHDGAIHYFLGQPLSLKLLPATRLFMQVVPGELRIATPSIEAADVQKAVMKFYSREAELRLPERVRFWHARMYSSPMPSLSFRAMKARWGSCAPDGSILLNSCLLRASWPAVDYVVVHELCHLTHFDHGAGFKALLGKTLSDWRERKKQLNVPCGF